MRDIRPTTSVSILHIYLNLWDQDYHSFGYEDNGVHTAAVHGFGNKYLDLLIYIYIYIYKVKIKLCINVFTSHDIINIPASLSKNVNIPYRLI